MNYSEYDIAWAAGLFEGEGCLTWHKRPNGRLYPHASLTTTDLDVIERFTEIMGFGNIGKPQIRPDRKPCWKWRAVGLHSMVALNDRIGIYLGNRRRVKLDEMLMFEPRRDSFGKQIRPFEISEEGRRSLHLNGKRKAGEGNGRAKLNWQQIDIIRTSKATTHELAEQYKISRGHVRRIRRYEEWIR